MSAPAPALELTPDRELSWWQALLIFFFPIAALLTLRSGYSATARFFSLGWLALVLGGRALLFAAGAGHGAHPLPAGAAPPVVSGDASQDALRAEFMRAFHKGCRASQPYCECVGNGIFDEVPVAELESVREAMANGRPDPRISGVLVRCR